MVPDVLGLALTFIDDVGSDPNRDSGSFAAIVDNLYRSGTNHCLCAYLKSQMSMCVSVCVPYFPCLCYVVEKEKVWTFGFGFGLVLRTEKGGVCCVFFLPL